MTDDGHMFNQPDSHILTRSKTETDIKNVENSLPTSSPDNLSSMNNNDDINNKTIQRLWAMVERIQTSVHPSTQGTQRLHRSIFRKIQHQYTDFTS